MRNVKNILIYQVISWGVWRPYLPNQTSDPFFFSCVEVISNAIDASGGTIGQFNRGVKQLLILLKSDGDSIQIVSHKKGTSHRLTIQNDKGVLFLSLKKLSQKEALNRAGTIVRVCCQRPFPCDSLRQCFLTRYSTLDQVHICLEGQCVHSFHQTSSLFNMSSKSVEQKSCEEVAHVYVDFKENGHVFEVRDLGCGMTADELLLVFVPTVNFKPLHKPRLEDVDILVLNPPLESKKDFIKQPLKVRSICFSRYGETLWGPFQVSESVSEGLDLCLELNGFLSPFESRQKIHVNELFFEAIYYLCETKILKQWEASDLNRVLLLDVIYTALESIVSYQPKEQKKMSDLGTLILNSIHKFFPLEEVDQVVDKKFLSSKILFSPRTLFLHSDLIPYSNDLSNFLLKNSIGRLQNESTYHSRPIYLIPFQYSNLSKFNLLDFFVFQTKEAVFLSDIFKNLLTIENSETKLICESLLSILFNSHVFTSYQEEKKFQEKVFLSQPSSLLPSFCSDNFFMFVLDSHYDYQIVHQYLVLSKRRSFDKVGVVAIQHANDSRYVIWGKKVFIGADKCCLIVCNENRLTFLWSENVFLREDVLLQKKINRIRPFSQDWLVVNLETDAFYDKVKFIRICDFVQAMRQGTQVSDFPGPSDLEYELVYRLQGHNFSGGMRPHSVFIYLKGRDLGRLTSLDDLKLYTSVQQIPPFKGKIYKPFESLF